MNMRIYAIFFYKLNNTIRGIYMSQTRRQMQPNAKLFEQIVELFSRPPALQVVPGFAKSPGGTVNPLFGDARAV